MQTCQALPSALSQRGRMITAGAPCPSPSPSATLRVWHGADVKPEGSRVGGRRRSGCHRRASSSAAFAAWMIARCCSPSSSNVSGVYFKRISAAMQVASATRHHPRARPGAPRFRGPGPRASRRLASTRGQRAPPDPAVSLRPAARSIRHSGSRRGRKARDGRCVLPDFPPIGPRLGCLHYRWLWSPIRCWCVFELASSLGQGASSVAFLLETICQCSSR